MKNLINHGMIFTEKNPSVFTILLGIMPIDATLFLSSEHGVRIFKGIFDGKFYVESFPFEGEDNIPAQLCPEKSIELAKSIARSNYESYHGYFSNERNFISNN